LAAIIETTSRKSNATIDRAALDVTRIDAAARSTTWSGRAQLSHRPPLRIVGQAGLSICVLGDYVTIAGQAGLAGLTVGTRAVVGAQAGVTKDIPDEKHVLVPRRGLPSGETSASLIESLPEFRDDRVARAAPRAARGRRRIVRISRVRASWAME
jgi:UDP-3-O-[3-hydroxymyristoyl] glucosamine N-acyltransferase